MLKANALFIVIIVSLVIGIFCSSLILVSYFQRLQVQKDQLIKKLDLNANSAINILLSGSDIFSYGEEKTMDLYGNDIDSVTIKKMLWGIFEIGSVNSFSKNFQKWKSIIYGYKLDDRKCAIYLPDQNSPLSLGGSTFINGDCYLPESGVKRAYIEGQAFSFANLIQGTIKKSK
ncbi:MAG TPA: hypothetical protein VD908_06600, partial [Cytophagales bacterium]|nr:hypothetical protein [Cytophagales bacterium]